MERRAGRRDPPCRVTHGGIEHAAQLVILFTADDGVARHDLTVTMDRAWSRGLRLDVAQVAGFAIGERLGNACCTAALVRLPR